MTYNVPISEDLVKKIIPDTEPKNPQEEQKRAQLMNTVAQALQK